MADGREWPDRRIIDLIGITLPIIQAPMAGAGLSELAIAVSEAGGLGSLPCAMLADAQTRAELARIRRSTARPINVNFFCHRPPETQAEREMRWSERLAEFYAEFGLDREKRTPGASRTPFDAGPSGSILPG